MLATIIITCRGATRDPMAEFKKFTASLLTHTTKSEMAKTKSTITITRYNSMASYSLSNFSILVNIDNNFTESINILEINKLLSFDNI